MENIQALLDPTTNAIENFIPIPPLVSSSGSGYTRNLIIEPNKCISLTTYRHETCYQYDEAKRDKKEQDINEVLSFIMDIEKILNEIKRTIKK